MSDRNKYWGLILTSGNASAVKKEDVQEIVDAQVSEAKE